MGLKNVEKIIMQAENFYWGRKSNRNKIATEKKHQVTLLQNLNELLYLAYDSQMEEHEI